jgi:PTH1 family peptidyl-tRNA hydrolase
MVAAKPQSFMNLSGQPAASLRGFYKVDVDQMIVVHDELDLPFGQVRVKKGGGHGGHNGLRDVQKRAGGNGFLRVRVGISRPPPEWDVADYVLSKWTSEEQCRLDDIVHLAADAVESVVRDGVDAAMNRFNVRPERGRQNLPVGAADSV